jgi:CRP-like cAMP-binding protein
MSDQAKPDRTPDEAAAISKEFLETIGKMMLRMEMHPRMAIHLFGLFANRLVENEVSRG